MPHRYPVFILARVVDDGDQPVTVLADIEDHVTIHIVGILEDLANLDEIPPSGLTDDAEPSPNLFGGIRILPFGLRQMLARDNVHDFLSKLPAKVRLLHMLLSRYFAF